MNAEGAHCLRVRELCHSCANDFQERSNSFGLPRMQNLENVGAPPPNKDDALPSNGPDAVVECSILSLQYFAANLSLPGTNSHVRALIGEAYGELAAVS
jgi:hypothetical protein